MDEYTRQVLARAEELRCAEAALTSLDEQAAFKRLRALMTAAVAALVTLFPAVSAAQLLLP